MSTTRGFDVTADFGRLRVRGASRLDFLHRMTTGDLAVLHPGQGAATVLTTPIGRSIDCLYVLAQPDSLLVITGGGNQDKVARWLRKFIFFNDDVQVTDETAYSRMYLVCGPEAQSQTRAALAASAEAAVLDHALAVLAPSAHFTHTEIGLAPAACLIKWPWPEQPAYAICAVTAAVQPTLNASWSNNIAYEAARIEAGVARFPNEIDERFVPLETGLWGAISFKKGCYTGQEIIARMESRGQISKKLVALQNVPDRTEPNDELRGRDGTPIGSITSVAGSFALAYIRTSALDLETTVQVADRGAAMLGRVIHGP